MNNELYNDVKNKTLYVDKENINDFLLNIMRENNVNVCIGMPTVDHDHFHHSSYSAEQRMIDEMESAREHIPMLHQVHYNTGGATRTLSSEEILNEWHRNKMLQYQLNIRKLFEDQFMLNPSRYFDEINTRDSYHVRDRKDRLDQRHLSQEEFQREILSRNRPRNEWFRNKHEKKRFIKGL